MELYSIIGTIFLELFVAALASMAFLLFVREYRRHRHPAMGWFAAAAAVQFAAHLLHFFAQYVASTGVSSLSIALFGSVMLAVIVHAFVVVRGAFALRRMGNALGNMLTVACAAAAAYAIYQIVANPPMLRFVQGIPFLEKGEPIRAATAFASLAAIAAVAMVVVVSRREARTTGKEEGFTKVLTISIIAGLVVRIATFLGDKLSVDEFVFVSLLASPVYIVCLYIGALACADSDPAVRRAPLTVVRRDLLTKSIALVMMVMLVMSFIIHTTVSVAFIGERGEEGFDGLERETDHYVAAYESAASRLLEDAARLAVAPGLVTALSSPTDASTADRIYGSAAEFIWRRNGARAVKVLDAQGIVVFSGLNKATMGSVFPGSPAVSRAIEGGRMSGVARNEAGEWVLQSAVPVEREGEVTHVIVLEQEIDPVLRDGADGHAQPDSAGLVLSTGEVAFVQGEPVDRLFVQEIGVAGTSREQFAMVNARGDGVYVRKLIAADGTVVGCIFAVQEREAMLVGIFREVAFVSFLVITGTMITILVIYLLLSRALRPIRSLRDAAEHIEKERYDLRVEYKGVDELGQLAASFNRMQDTIARRTGELKTALREQQSFVDHTARELRNPVNIFRWTLELMRFGDTGRLNKDQLELLEQLHQTNERLFKVVQNLQDAVRIDQGKFVLKFRPVVIEDVIDEVAGMVAVRARSKGVTFHWNRPTKPLPPVRADGGYLLKIMHNLVSNGVKYTLKGGHVEVDVELVDEVSPGGKKGKYIKVNIEDNGIGIPQNEQQHIFERFYRAKNAIEGEIQGTGLGLFIAKHVIERHGGAVWFRSREEVGTAFTLTLPVDDAPESRPKKKS